MNANEMNVFAVLEEQYTSIKGYFLRQRLRSRHEEITQHSSLLATFAELTTTPKVCFRRIV
jgi:hypothetical protein